MVGTLDSICMYSTTRPANILEELKKVHRNTHVLRLVRALYEIEITLDEG